MTARRPVVAALGLLALLGALAGPARADIDPTVGDIAGNGTSGFAGDGGPAGAALMRAPRDTAQLPDGTVLIADRDNDRIRAVGANGNINTVAGNPGACSPGPPCGDGGGALGAALNKPAGVTPLANGGYLIADTADHRIRQVAPGNNGQITTVAGTTAGFSGDGGPATAAKLSSPSDTSLMPDGGYLIADTGNNRIRRVLPDGRITTVAGASAAAYTGDTGPATSARLNAPADVDVAADGSYYIADTGNNVVRFVSTAGVITTVAGRGDAGEAGDGRPALRALLDGPLSVDALPSGGFMVADTDNDRIRRVSAGGTISTEAGTTAGSQTGPGSQAKLQDPASVTVDSNGRVLFADSGNNRVRALSVTGEPPAANFNDSVVLDPLDGTTTVKAPNGTSLTLKSDENVPIGSVVDTTSSETLLTVEPETTGGVDRTALSLGPFAMRQVTTKTKPITELILKDLPPRCSTKTAKAKASGGLFHAIAQVAATKRRRLFARGRGRFRTRGRYGSGTKRGTEFLTEDRCDGTLFKVREGQIAVRDFVTGKTIIVKAGERYFARQGKRRVKP
jgi:sugar lactone lactonase YvrE